LEVSGVAETEKSGQKAIRDERGRFLPGAAPVSPGRPAIAREFRQKCREFMEREGGGWDMLIKLAANGKASDRRYALELIAAYAYGKPRQGVEVSGEGGGPVVLATVPTAEIVERAKAAIAQVEARHG
jgi:hypothetical protein